MKNKTTIALFTFLFVLCQSAFGQNIPNLTATSASGTITNTTNSQLPNAYSTSGSPVYNFVRTWVPTQPVSNPLDLTSVASFASVNAKMVTSYSDGFGRSIEKITRFTNTLKDLVEFSDTRPSLNKLTFLAYPTTYNSHFRTSPYTESQSYYYSLYPQEGYTAASMTSYLSSATEHTIKSYMPGKGFFGIKNSSETTDRLNDANEVVLWTFNYNTYLPVNGGFYAASSLIKHITKRQADGSENIDYRNKQGQLICSKRLSSGSTYLTTYYLYDNMGRVIMTVPPKATEQLLSGAATTSQIVEDLCPYKKFDALGRVYQEHISGETGCRFFAYDQKNRPILSQTPALRQEGKWMYTMYDAIGRITSTALLTNSNTYSYFQDIIANSANWYMYYNPNNIFYYILFADGAYFQSIPDCEMLSYTYYDDYSHIPGYNFNFSAYGGYYLNPNSTGTILWPTSSDKVYGKVTGRKVKILKDPSSNLMDWKTEVYFYDQYDNLIQTYSVNAQFGTNIISTQYSFTGQPLRNIVTYSNGLSNSKPYTTIAKSYDYSAQTSQLISIKQSIDNSALWRTIVNYSYDDMGRMSHKNVGSTIETQSYTYNIRGQLTGINKDYAETGMASSSITFGESLKYDYGFNQVQLNGKVAGMIWKGTGTSPSHAYGYSYDLADRMTEAEFSENVVPAGGTTSSWNKTQSDYTVSDLSYDANGNIKSMNQMAVADVTVNGVSQSQIVQMDALNYHYANNERSNRLQSVSDISSATDLSYHLNDFIDRNTSSQDFDYDNNGNTKQDLNKEITSTTYNFLNLPVHVSFNSGKVIDYTYDAEGQKLREVVNDGVTITTYDYIGALVFKNNDLQFAYHDEGRTRYHEVGGNMVWDYDYFVKDHLNNVRSVLTAQETSWREYLATHELASANLETALFDRIPEVRDPKPASIDSDDLEAARLNGSDPNRTVGTALMLRVMAGDQFQLSTDSYYDAESTEQGEPLTAQQMMNTIVSALVGGQGGFEGGGDGRSSHDVITSLFSSSNYIDAFDAIKQSSIDPARPHAFINYLVYDERMRLIPEQSGVIQVGQAGSWENLDLNNTITVGKNGFLVVYISNESKKDVYFDRVTIKFYKGSLLEEQHYYPHGLVINSSTILPLVDRQNLYQTKIWQKSIGLNLYDFNARQYDPQLGRFQSLDSKEQFSSGYIGMANNPATNVDPSGKWSISVNTELSPSTARTCRTISLAAAVVAITYAGIVTGGAVTAGVAGMMSAGFAGSIAGGFIAGAAGGAAGGFAAGYGAGVLNGGDPFQSGGEGALQGAISGGISGAAFNALNILTSPRHEYYLNSKAGGLTTQDVQTLTNQANAYNSNTALVASNDARMGVRMQNQPDLIAKGKRWKLQGQSTRVPKNYGFDNHKFVKLSNGQYVDAITAPGPYEGSFMYVSEGAVNNYSDIQFQGLMVHEFTHVFQVTQVGGTASGYWSNSGSMRVLETAAYNSQQLYLLKHGEWLDAMRIQTLKIENGYNITDPGIYMYMIEQ